jgi:hypothetical protein
MPDELNIEASTRSYLPPEDKLDEAEAAELQAYMRAVDSIIREDSGSSISNGSPLHARFILARMFECARSEVVVFSRHFLRMATDPLGLKRSRVWANERLVTAARDFLRSEGRVLSILVSGKLDSTPSTLGSDHPFLKQVLEDTKRLGTLNLVVLGSDSANSLSNSGFASADGKIYRLETSADGLTAEASFNAPTLSKLFRANFHTLVRRASRSKTGYSVTSIRPESVSIPTNFLENLIPTT